MFDDAVRRGADIISVAATYGGDVVPAARRAIAAGVVVVGAAGADDVVNSVFPSDMEGAVSVYAVDERAKPWNHQRNTGSPVISAPASSWRAASSTTAGGVRPAGRRAPRRRPRFTSKALALVKAKYPRSHPQPQAAPAHGAPARRQQPLRLGRHIRFGMVSVTEMLQTNPTSGPTRTPGPRT